MSEASLTPSRPYPLGAYVRAWAVHALTLSGLLWVLLAARSLHAGDYKLMWLWLGVALITDALDGPLARKAQVTKVVPWFSGVMMDNVVDYMTWTFVPSIFMAQALELGPQPLPIVAAVCAMVSSMFCYANTNMKSSDWYFVGFPAAWNIIAIILWFLGLPGLLNWAVIVAFSILAVVPWKWVHPFRVKHLRRANAAAAIVWVVTTAAWIVTYPSAPFLIWMPWLVSGLWILGVSAARTIKGPARR
ncbi:MAG: CDP-alcohol phosphatidyltransferase family protein [Actinomycetaceae bacterium]|nr:CDP-alcohol phosphatidyltransferase family protein [Actinomycetaceae bacterium]